MNQERRQYGRAKSPVLIEFGQGSAIERSFTYDISEGGLRFPTTAELRVGQELVLTLDLPQQERCQATAQVVWIRELAKIGATQYDVGVRFRWMEDPDRQRLRRHLQPLLKKV